MIGGWQYLDIFLKNFTSSPKGAFKYHITPREGGGFKKILTLYKSYVRMGDGV